MQPRIRVLAVSLAAALTLVSVGCGTEGKGDDTASGGKQGTTTTVASNDGTTAVDMTNLTGTRANRMHMVFRNVYQLRSQGLM